MATKSTWETFFDAHAPVYNENIFTKNTLAEVDFLIEELGLAPGAAILDVGCGTGRHAVELAGRGYAVTGVDLSAGMLAQAAAAAKVAGVAVELVHADATNFSLPGKYDAAICLCEGSFGLLGQGDDPVDQPLAILSNISRCLKPGAKALLTVLSASRLFRMHTDADVAEGCFDPLSIAESSDAPAQQGMAPLPVRERGFVGTELSLLCRLAGLTIENMWGGTAGNWGHRPLELDEYEIMLVARKTGEPVGPG